MRVGCDHVDYTSQHPEPRSRLPLDHSPSHQVRRAEPCRFSVSASLYMISFPFLVHELPSLLAANCSPYTPAPSLFLCFFPRLSAMPRVAEGPVPSIMYIGSNGFQTRPRAPTSGSGRIRRRSSRLFVYILPFSMRAAYYTHYTHNTTPRTARFPRAPSRQDKHKPTQPAQRCTHAHSHSRTDARVPLLPVQQQSACSACACDTRLGAAVLHDAVPRRRVRARNDTAVVDDGATACETTR